MLIYCSAIFCVGSYAAGQTFHEVACPQTPIELKELLRPGSTAIPLLSAHRGGAGRGLPENCLATFENTLLDGFTLLEVDPRRTSDGQFVLHHDPSLTRTTTGSGLLSTTAWQQVQQLQLKDVDGNVTHLGIPTLKDAIQWASGKCVLVLDSKDVSVAERVSLITDLKAEATTMMLIYSLADAQECYRLNPKIMMEYAITTQRQFDQFDTSGIPWSNIVAFVGHSKPTNDELIRAIHARGAACMAGTSRYLDKQLIGADEATLQKLRTEYRSLLEMGIDIIETDTPHEVRRLLNTQL
ncbi:MAG: glycerophosphodiester phosphodiesterase family protein [Planctomycetales bacterium]|nr:glycerophosphodiester phosphodiesterase family protein [Planctomycetales bacterium]